MLRAVRFGVGDTHTSVVMQPPAKRHCSGLVDSSPQPDKHTLLVHYLYRLLLCDHSLPVYARFEMLMSIETMRNASMMCDWTLG